MTVEWRNELDGPLPVIVTIAPAGDRRRWGPGAVRAGTERRHTRRARGGATGHTVVHLHGGLTPASYDGWAENLFAPGQPAVFHYPMDQRAALLWYHDHVMGVTKFDVYAGLAGLWIVRDERERELGLPEGPPFEVPLLIQDRNFDLDDHGRLTGRLVHKTDPEVMEAFAPFTVVNGKVWPVLDVQPATYRFRVINGSNARTYRLVLLRDGEPDLTGSPRSAPTTAYSAPPSRAAGRPRARVGRARRPARRLLRPRARQRAHTAQHRRRPLRRHRLPRGRRRATPRTSTGCCPIRRSCASGSSAGSVTRRPDPERARRPTTRRRHPEALAGAPRRAIALVERELDGEPNMLTMRELAIADDEHSGPLVTLTDGERDHPLPHRRRPLRGHHHLLPDPRPVRGLAAHQPHRRHAPHPPPPRPVPDPRTTPDPLRDPRRRHRRLRPRRHSDTRARPRRRARPRHRRQRTRPQGHRSASTPTRSSKSPSASPPTAAGTCTTATSSNTKTAT